MLDHDSVAVLLEYIHLLTHLLRLKTIIMLLNLDPCVFEFWYIFQEPQSLISCTLKKRNYGGLIKS